MGRYVIDQNEWYPVFTLADPDTDDVYDFDEIIDVPDDLAQRVEAAMGAFKAAQRELETHYLAEHKAERIRPGCEQPDERTP